MAEATEVVLEKEFQRAVSKLSKSDKAGKDAATKALAACTSLRITGDAGLQLTHHGESRIKNCEKYDLGGAYRLVTTRVPGKPSVVGILFVGSHAEADAWLDRHRGFEWVKRKSDGLLDFVLVTTEAGQAPAPEVNLDTPEHVLDEPLLHGFNQKVFDRLKLTSDLAKYVRAIAKSDWVQNHNAIIDHIEKISTTELALLMTDILTLIESGDSYAAECRIDLFVGDAEIADGQKLAIAMTDAKNCESFISWDDSVGLPSPESWQEWMLYLHPEQKKMAFADLSGAARLRGVSGSGKTCVLIHRARYLAKKYDEPVLVVTLTESMRQLLEVLITALCGVERTLIETMTVSAAAKDFIRCLHPKGEKWYTPISDTIKNGALIKVAGQVQRRLIEADLALGKLPYLELRQYVVDEISYVRGRLLPHEYSGYTSSSFKRVGRGQALSESARKIFLDAIIEYDNYINGFHQLDHEAIVQSAVHCVESSDNSPWRAVLADEVQDLSQLEIRLLASIKTSTGDKLGQIADGVFLVGDGAQTIYKKGFSLSSLGINVSSRSYVFKKNYRNTYEILLAAYGLIVSYEFADIDEDSTQKPLEPDFAVRQGDRPMLTKCKSARDEAEFIATQCQRYRDLDGEDAINEICVIARTNIMRDLVARTLKEAGIRNCAIRDNVGLIDSGVRISTIESAKGHEFKTVFIAGLSEDSKAKVDISDETSRDASKLYVAMTRARDNLYISYTSNDRLKPINLLRAIQSKCEEVEWHDKELQALQ